MSTRLSFKQIEQRYDSQWVLLDELDLDKYDQIKRARVVFHSSDLDAVHRKAMKSKSKQIARIYIGEKAPKDVGVIL